MDKINIPLSLRAKFLASSGKGIKIFGSKSSLR